MFYLTIDEDENSRGQLKKCQEIKNSERLHDKRKEETSYGIDDCIHVPCNYMQFLL